MAKSDAYQYRFAEISVDPTLFSELTEEEGLTGLMALSVVDERISELKEQLLIEVLRLVKTHLTARQAEVVALRLRGYTQDEIAVILEVCQPTVHGLLQGTRDYRNGRQYGGAIRKLNKVASDDNVICDIFAKMAKIREDT